MFSLSFSRSLFVTLPPPLLALFDRGPSGAVCASHGEEVVCGVSQWEDEADLQCVWCSVYVHSLPPSLSLSVSLSNSNSNKLHWRDCGTVLPKQCNVHTLQQNVIRKNISNLVEFTSTFLGFQSVLSKCFCFRSPNVLWFHRVCSSFARSCSYL